MSGGMREQSPLIWTWAHVICFGTHPLRDDDACLYCELSILWAGVSVWNLPFRGAWWAFGAWRLFWLLGLVDNRLIDSLMHWLVLCKWLCGLLVSRSCCYTLGCSYCDTCYLVGLLAFRFVFFLWLHSVKFEVKLGSIMETILSFQLRLCQPHQSK